MPAARRALVHYVGIMTRKFYLQLAGAGLVAAVLLGLLAAGQLVLSSMGDDKAWTFGHAVIMQTPYWAFWALLFPAIVWLVRAYPIERGMSSRTVAIHVGAGIGIVFLHYGTQLYFMHAIGHGYPSGHSYISHFVARMQWRLWVHVVGYMTLLGVALLRDYYLKYRERELLTSRLQAQLSQAQLRALRMQLHPHFLFNALNSIAMLTRRNENSAAVRMIAGLGELLRYVLEDAPADEVLLRDEIRFATRYLEIERVRFSDRLSVDIDAPDATLDAFVPNLVLQPLVENAIRHGIARKPSAGRIEIAARRTGGMLELEVRDDGPGIADGVRLTAGVGLANVRARLEQLYGDDFIFELGDRHGGGTRAVLRLPYRTLPAATAVTA